MTLIEEYFHYSEQLLHLVRENTGLEEKKDISLDKIREIADKMKILDDNALKESIVYRAYYEITIA